MTASPLRLLIPALPSSPGERLCEIAGGLIDFTGGQATLLGVVEVPQDRSLSEGAMVVRRRRRALQRIPVVRVNPRFQAEVRTAHSIEAGIRDVAREIEADLMLLRWKPARVRTPGGVVERLVADPPCDLGVIKPGSATSIERVLVPARGGLHAELALRLAQAIAAQHGALLTLLHVVLPEWNGARRAQEEQYFNVVRHQVSYAHVDEREIEAESVASALLSEGARHDLVVMGSAGRDQRSSYMLGMIPETVAQKLCATTVIVKTREPVTADMFGMRVVSLAPPIEPDLSELVDRWFAENTFHSDEFQNIQSLVELKQRRGVTISLALPTLNEEKTVGKIVTTIKRRLMDRYPLIDEMVVVDSQSEDRTAEIVTSLGVPVYQHPDILPELGTYRGKGEGLWKSLQVTSGDIVVWIDSDITGIHPKFVYGLIGPLLTQPRIGFVKGFYRRPLNLGGQLLTTGGGRVTELTARPLINLFYPQLSGLVQPLAGEMAGRREVLESVPMFTGYGVETGLLIDILEQFGLQSIAQVDLQERVHRNQSLLSLSKMAFAIVQVVIQRLGERERLRLLAEMNTSMKLIHYSPTELFLEVQSIEEHERPPIKTLLQYAEHRSSRTAALATAETR
ncbi:MAG: hypothetical protein PVSMB7_03780 [Chloroflexota bacterium]